MEKKTLAQLQTELKELNAAHDRLEVAVKVWNEKRRKLDESIRKAEGEMLALRVKAWRSYQESAKQMQIDL